MFWRKLLISAGPRTPVVRTQHANDLIPSPLVKLAGVTSERAGSAISDGAGTVYRS